mmetsp:Transcript_10440/g.11337  ORF Transcript_10440/g.11337 Transcript_10440/m.11337 type:complete len:421 (-) Transcript_10440:35-1297(-)
MLRPKISFFNKCGGSYFCPFSSVFKPRKNGRYILGIESSFDESSAALVHIPDGKLIGQETLSQWKDHQAFGGIVPKLASESHDRNLPIVVEDVLKQSQVSLEDISFIALTVGPGLVLSLNSGIKFATQFGQENNIPIMPINHIEAHCLSPRFEIEEDQSPNPSYPYLDFPYLTFLVTGAHTELIKCTGLGKYEVLGFTMDDSIGEAFDKVARDLELNYLATGQIQVDNPSLAQEILGRKHGGAQVEICARYGDPEKFPLPIPMINHQGCDFSFSGIKSAVKRYLSLGHKELKFLPVRKEPTIQERCDLSASFQLSCTAHLKHRLRKVLRYYKKNGEEINGVAIVGGVASNQYIKQELRKIAEMYDTRTFSPPSSLCVDNAAMIAWTGLEYFNAKKKIEYSQFPVAAERKLPLGDYTDIMF